MCLEYSFLFSGFCFYFCEQKQYQAGELFHIKFLNTLLVNGKSFQILKRKAVARGARHLIEHRH